jgi:hypothetical protein
MYYGTVVLKFSAKIFMSVTHSHCYPMRKVFVLIGCEFPGAGIFLLKSQFILQAVVIHLAECYVKSIMKI